MNNFFKYQEFRNIYPEFHYLGYEIAEEEESLGLTYHFKISGLAEFKPQWEIPKKKENGEVLSHLKNLTGNLRENKTLRKLIFSLGMVELISYWKIACPKKVIIHPAEGDELSKEELPWWKEQYFHGLGEFFYTNEIPLDADGFMDLEIRSENGQNVGENAQNDSSRIDKDLTERDVILNDERMLGNTNVLEENGGGALDSSVIFQSELQKNRKLHSTLIPIGGGKDSVVTLELLADNKENNFCFMINGRGATLDSAEVAGYGEDKIIIVKRSLDKEMLRLNKEGFLNGHTPFSAIVAFSTVLVSYLYGIPFIALSNEGSANESTVEGSTVNHQYSKSFKFEMDFFNYEKTYIASGVHYFSLLRGWTEYRIAKNFAEYKKYHKIFRSCNVGSKENRWCAHCPKCLFVYLMLGAFLPQKELVSIFGGNMLNDLSMWEDMRKLVGEVPEKPFECVGSRDEVNVAVCETIRRMEEEKEELPKLFSLYKETESYQSFRSRKGEELLGFSEENNIPEF